MRGGTPTKKTPPQLNLLPSQSPCTHADTDKPYKARSPSLPSSPTRSGDWVSAQLGDCGSSCLGDSCCNSWSPDMCKDLDLASLSQIVTALPLRALSKDKAGRGGRCSEEQAA